MNRTLLAVLPLALLIGCGTGPSDSDMNEAIAQSMQESYKQMESVVGNGPAERFKEPAPTVKKIGCQKDGESAFVCDVEVTTADRKVVSALRFVKSSDGWRITGRAQQ